MKLVDAIMKGTDLHSFFYSKCYGPIKFRPLNNSEISNVMDRISINASDGAIEVINSFVFKIKPKIEATKDALIEASGMYNTLNKWICYHGLKDFQGEEWSHVDDNGVPFGIHVLEHPQSYLEINSLAREIMSFTTAEDEKISSFLETEEGKILAKATWNLYYPLSDRIWNLTNVQLKFIKVSHDHVRKKTESEEFDTLEELMDAINFKPVRPMTKEEREMQKKWEEIRESVSGRNKHRPKA